MEFTELLAQATTPPDPGAAPKRNTPLADVEDMIIQGQYAFPTGKMINVIGPDGDSYSAPSDQIKDALENGYRLESPNEIAKREFRKEYKGLKGDALVFFGQFADEFLGGLPEIALDKLASKDAFDKKETLKEDHELANTLGGVAGFASSTFYGGPLAKLFGVGEKVGAKASEAVAKSLAKRGINKESANLGAQVLAKTAEKSADLGVQGLVSAAPIALTETALGDPEAGAETLLMGGGLGLGLGIVAGPTSVIFSKANKAAKEAVEKRFGQFEKQAPATTSGGNGSLVSEMDAAGVDESIISKISEGIKKPKSNIDEIKEAFDFIGEKPTEGIVTADKVAQDLESALSKKATVAGIKKARQFQNIFDKVDGIVKKVFDVGSDDLTRFNVGEKAKVGIIEPAKREIDALGKIFESAMLNRSQIAVDQKSLMRLASNLDELTRLTYDPKVKSVIKQLQNDIRGGFVTDLETLSIARTNLQKSLEGAASPILRQRVGVISDRLTDLDHRTIDKAIKETIERASVPGEATFGRAMEIQAMADEYFAARKAWANLAENLKESGDALGLSTIKNPMDFIRKVSDLTGEELTKRLLPKNDVASMRLLAERFPEQFEAVKNLEKAKILEGVIADDRVKLFTWKNQFAKLIKDRPELAQTIFSADEMKALKHAKVILESIPENVNPSGTAKTLSYMGAISEGIKGGGLTGALTENLSDYVLEKTLKKMINVDDIINTQKEIGAVSKKLDKVPSIIKGLQTIGKVTEKMSPISSIYATSQLLGESSAERRASFEKIKAKLEEVATSPELMEDFIVKESEGYSASAPNVTNKYIQKASTAVNYLYQNLPKPMQQPSPFFKREWKPSDMDLAKFERKLAVTMDPFVVIDALQDGSLTKDHMEALIVNYPRLAQAMQGRVLDELTKSPANLPYQARLKVSLLMGFDIDRTTTAKSVANYQNSFAMMPEISQNEDELNQSGLNKMKPAEPEWTQAQHGLLK